MDKSLADVVERFDTTTNTASPRRRGAACRPGARRSADCPLEGRHPLPRRTGARLDRRAARRQRELVAICDMLAGRDARSVDGAVSRNGRQYPAILLALNRVFLPEPRFKWADRLVERCPSRRPDLGKRLRWVYQASRCRRGRATAVDGRGFVSVRSYVSGP